MIQMPLFPDQEEENVSSQVAIPAKVLAKPGKGVDGKILGQSGRLYLELFNKKDPMFAFSRTLLATFPLALMKFSMTWKVKATQRGRLYCQLKRVVRRTEETDSGLSQEMWATPIADDAKNVSINPKRFQGLYQQVQMWPTPTGACVVGTEQSDRVEKTETGGYILRKKNKPHMTYGAKLSDAILWEEKQVLPTNNQQR